MSLNLHSIFTNLNDFFEFPAVITPELDIFRTSIFFPMIVNIMINNISKNQGYCRCSFRENGLKSSILTNFKNFINDFFNILAATGHNYIFH